MSWIAIPKYAEPGQAHAFADRETQLVRLYRFLVDAGNAVREGKAGVRHKHVVFGQMGVGKSSLILQTLSMLRNDLSQEGQRIPDFSGLPEPNDRPRWLVIRVSGKNVGSIDALAGSFQSSISLCADGDLHSDVSAAGPPSEPMLSFFDDVTEAMERDVPGAVQLPIIHKLLRRREAKLYNKVRSTLESLSHAIDFVRRWYGSTQVETLSVERTGESKRDAEARIKAQLKAKTPSLPDTPEADLALAIAAGVIRRSGESMRATNSVERRWRVHTEQVVWPLNELFRATDRAGLPTVLVLDDFDEFTSSVGPSVRDRSRVLSWILGPLSELEPTCLVLGLREEYMHEDIKRKFDTTHVPAMSRRATALSIEAWAEVQQPPLSAEEVAQLQRLADKILEPFANNAPVVVPFRFLQMLVAVYRTHDWASETTWNLLVGHVNEDFYPEAAQALVKLAQVMPEEHVLPCAAMTPLDPTPYSFTEREQLALEQAGLLRPAMAGDPDNPMVVIDSLAAYLHEALRLEQGA